MNYAETSGVEQQIGGADGVVDFSGTTNPGQSGEANAGVLGRGGVELVMRIDHRADFAAAGGDSQNMQQRGGAARRARAGNLSDGAAR
jgi:hypothetical protein